MYRSSHRGTKENDLILGPFAEHHVHAMSEVERTLFAEFLECPDESIYFWLRAQDEEIPVDFLPLIQKIRQSTNL